MAVAHAALGDNIIGKMLNVAHVPLQHGNFQTIVMINMHMQSGDGEIVMVMDEGQIVETQAVGDALTFSSDAGRVLQNAVLPAFPVRRNKV